MIGLIHKTLFHVVESTGGAEALAEVKRRAGVPPEQHFGINEVYDDVQWQRLFAAAVEVLDVSPQQAEEVFAEHFLADALKRWPVWFQMSPTAREMLQRQPVIHNSMATGVRDAAARRLIEDKFQVKSHDGELITYYRSPNRHCGLYKALVRRVLAHYGEQATVEESQCMKEGAHECVIHTLWTTKEQGT